jgi:hypothetical protein
MAGGWETPSFILVPSFLLAVHLPLPLKSGVVASEAASPHLSRETLKEFTKKLMRGSFAKRS